MKVGDFLICLMASAGAFAIGFLIGEKHPQTPPYEPDKAKVDTLYIRDTITLSQPIIEERKVVEIVPIPVVDTMRVHDTLYVYLEREQIRWEDSLSVVWASGIDPKVDSVTHFVTNMVITKEIPVVEKVRSRWGLGISAGYGFSAQGLSPYVGVGVSYNILSW